MRDIKAEVLKMCFLRLADVSINVVDIDCTLDSWEPTSPSGNVDVVPVTPGIKLIVVFLVVRLFLRLVLGWLSLKLRSFQGQRLKQF